MVFSVSLMFKEFPQSPHFFFWASTLVSPLVTVTIYCIEMYENYLENHRKQYKVVLTFIISSFTNHVLHYFLVDVNICGARRRNKITTLPHIWSHRSPSCDCVGRNGFGGGDDRRTQRHASALSNYWPWATARLICLVTLLYKSPWYPPTTRLHSGGQTVAWTCSVTPPLPGFLQRREVVPMGTLITKAKGHP